ncbi:MAG TPA: lysophospholipid acyltransferase family protein [Blastocatellia bacterium]|nr:lysophospholipid acyltransferase family protein [Blastocatellia bacterium]
MNHLRAIIRAVAFTALTVGLYVVWAAGALFALPLERASYRWRCFVFRSWARATARLLGARIEIRGAPPEPPFFLVSNHLSYVDVAIFASAVDCVFIAKQDVSRWPLLGLLSRSMGTIFINREKRRDVARVNALIERALASGKGIVLFAEGTSTEGAAVRPFKPALLERAAALRLPVSYASISYSTPAGEAPAHLSVCWWGDMTFLDHLFALFRLPGFHATLAFGPRSIQETDRKLLALKLRQAVEEQFIPVVLLEEECSAKAD